MKLRRGTVHAYQIVPFHDFHFQLWSCSLDHHVLFRLLLLFHFTKATGIETFEATENEGSVFSTSDLLVDGFESAGHRCLLVTSVGTVIVDIEEHLLVRQASGLTEGALELSKLVFTCGRGWVKDKDNSMSALLNRTPAFLIAPIARHIPEFDVNFSENASGSRCVLFVLDDSKWRNWVRS